MSDVIFLSNVRLSFPHVAEPQRQINEQTGKERISYNAEFIMEPNHPGFAQFWQKYNEMMVATRTAGFGAEVKRRIMLGTYALSAGYYDAFYGQAQKVRTLICRDFEAAYENFDVLLSPTSPTTAFELGAIHDPLTMYLNDICTIPTNLAGHPAMSVPFGTGDDGLPVGVQILAPALGEVPMFRAAAAVEAAAP